jgi:hypothetical protein
MNVAPAMSPGTELPRRLGNLVQPLSRRRPPAGASARARGQSGRNRLPRRTGSRRLKAHMASVTTVRYFEDLGIVQRRWRGAARFRWHGRHPARGAEAGATGSGAGQLRIDDVLRCANATGATYMLWPLCCGRAAAAWCRAVGLVHRDPAAPVRAGQGRAAAGLAPHRRGAGCGVGRAHRRLLPGARRGGARPPPLRSRHVRAPGDRGNVVRRGLGRAGSPDHDGRVARAARGRGPRRSPGRRWL